MFISRQHLRDLEARIKALEDAVNDLDPLELLNLRQSARNAIRAVQRVREAEEQREAKDGPLTLAEARRRAGR